MIYSILTFAPVIATSMKTMKKYVADGFCREGENERQKLRKRVRGRERDRQTETYR